MLGWLQNISFQIQYTIKLMLETGDKFIVLNNVAWKGIGFYAMIGFWKNEIEKSGRIVYTVFAPELTGSPFFFLCF